MLNKNFYIFFALFATFQCFADQQNSSQKINSTNKDHVITREQIEQLQTNYFQLNEEYLVKKCTSNNLYKSLLNYYKYLHIERENRPDKSIWKKLWLDDLNNEIIKQSKATENILGIELKNTLDELVLKIEHLQNKTMNYEEFENYRNKIDLLSRNSVRETRDKMSTLYNNLPELSKP